MRGGITAEWVAQHKATFEKNAEEHATAMLERKRRLRREKAPKPKPRLTDEQKRIRACENTRKRNITQRSAIPPWYERDEVLKLYEKCGELNDALGLEGFDRLTVDHIIPIRSETVCGLHCMANLQLLNRVDNTRKNNTYQTDW